MLKYLSTTFTFGKQTKDNFINRKFQCRPTYSFIHSFFVPDFPLGRIGVGSSPRRTRNTSRSQQSQMVLLAPCQDETKQGRRYSHSTWSLDDLWAAFPWVWTVSRRTYFTILSWDILDTWPNEHSWDLSIWRNGFTSWALRISNLCFLSRSVTP